MGRKHTLHQFQNAVEQDNLILFGEIPSFVNQKFKRFLRQVIRVDPCQVKPDLQVAKILFGVGFNCRGNRGIVRAATQVQQFLIAWVNRDDVVPVCVKESLEDEILLLGGQFPRGHFRQHPVEVFYAVFRVILQLADQRRGQVDGRPNAFLSRDYLRHVKVILGGVHTHPRAGVNAVLILIIHRLMLMPGEVYIQRIFLRSRSFCCRRLVNLGSCRFNRHVGWSGLPRAACRNSQAEDDCKQ